MYIGIEREGLYFAARVAPRFVQFAHDVVQRRKAAILRRIPFQRNVPPQFLVADKFFHGGPRILGHPLHQGITFGMHGCIVQRILTSRNAQETGALLKGFRPHAFHFHQIPPSGEGTVFRAVVHDILCQLRPQTRHVSQQLATRSIQVDSHGIHARFYRTVQRFPQFRLVHVVLVLSDTDGFRVYLHQFRQRVHQPASDGNGTAHRHVIFREFLTGDFGSRIDGSPVFAHHERFYRTVETDRLHEALRLATGRTVPYGYGLYVVLFH